MATLAAIEKQIAELKKKADGLRQAEAKSAIAQARELIQRFGLTAEDLGLSGRGSKRVAKAASKAKAPGAPKYRDPATGKTWTGHGKPPGWIAGVADRSAFLIQAEAAAPAAKPRAAAKKAAPKKARAAKTQASTPAKKSRAEAAAEAAQA